MELRIFVFGCGQGDTILLDLAGKAWVLVDCYLPKGEVREKFFRLVDELAINRLELVCLTHPHDDHYLGMADVIGYFTTQGRSVGTFCDSGVNGKEIVTLLRRRNRPAAYVTEFEKLDRMLNDLILKRRVVDYIRADENSRPLVSEDGERLQLLAIGPTPVALKQSARAAVTRGSVRDDLNVISLVLALRVRGTSAFDAVLAGDTDSESSNRAIERLAEMSKSEVRFDFVKVAHHGSWASHRGTKLYQLCKNKSQSVAVISAGADFDVLPDRKVMEQFLAEGWVLLLTTKRFSPKSQYNAVIETAASEPTEYSVQSQTISVKWGETSGLRWYPPEARVRHEDLSVYQTSDV